MRFLARWKAGTMQDRMLSIILLMIGAAAIVGGPLSVKAPAVVPLLLEGFGALILVALLASVKVDLRPTTLKSELRSGAGIAALALLILSTVSTVFSHRVAMSVQATLLLGIGVMVYFIVSRMMNRSHLISRLVDGLLLIGTVGAIYGCIQYGAQPDVQAVGLFGDHQLFGSFLMILLPFAAVQSYSEKSTNRQTAAFMATVVIAIAMLLAHSRSAWIGSASGLLACGLLAAFAPATGRKPVESRAKFVMPGLMIAASIVFFLLVSPMSSSVLNRATSLTDVSSQEAWTDRQIVWHGAMSMIKDHPIAGVGAGVYPYAHYGYTHRGIPVEQIGGRPTMSNLAHNLYLQTTAELGVFGFVALVAVLGLFWIRSISRLRKMEAGIRRNILIASLAASVAFAVDAFASPSWQFGHIAVLFWTVIGVGEACTREAVVGAARNFQQKSMPSVAQSRWAAALGILALVGVSPLAVQASRRTTSIAYSNVSSIKILVYPDSYPNDPHLLVPNYYNLPNVPPIGGGDYKGIIGAEAQTQIGFGGLHNPAITGNPAVTGAYDNAIPVPYPIAADTNQHFWNIGNERHYKMQVYVYTTTGDHGPITLDTNTTVSVVRQAYVGSGLLIPEPYLNGVTGQFEANNASNPWNLANAHNVLTMSNGWQENWYYGPYGDFIAYQDTIQDQGYKVTINASYMGQTTSTQLDFSGGSIPGRIGGTGGNAVIGSVAGAVVVGGILLTHDHNVHKNHHDKTTEHDKNHHDKTTEHVDIVREPGAANAGVIRLQAMYFAPKETTGTAVTLNPNAVWSVVEGDGFVTAGPGAEEFHGVPGRTATVKVTYTTATGVQTATVTIETPK